VKQVSNTIQEEILVVDDELDILCVGVLKLCKIASCSIVARILQAMYDCYRFKLPILLIQSALTDALVQKKMVLLSPNRGTNDRQKIREKGSKRCPMVIYARILEICTGAGLLKTQIMYKTNISFAMTIAYLANLREWGLLETSIYESRQIYKITEKGRTYLYHYYQLQQLAEKRDTTMITSTAILD